MKNENCSKKVSRYVEGKFYNATFQIQIGNVPTTVAFEMIYHA